MVKLKSIEEYVLQVVVSGFAADWRSADCRLFGPAGHSAVTRPTERIAGALQQIPHEQQIPTQQSLQILSLLRQPLQTLARTFLLRQ